MKRYEKEFCIEYSPLWNVEKSQIFVEKIKLKNDGFATLATIGVVWCKWKWIKVFFAENWIIGIINW